MPPQNVEQSTDNVNVIPRSTGEHALGAFNAATSGAVGLDAKGTPLDGAIAAHHQARLDQARKHYADATTYAAVLAHGMDPETGQPLDDAGKQKYNTLRDAAWDAYAKIAGVSPETKKAIDTHKTITDAVIQHGQSQQGAGGFPAPPSMVGRTGGVAAGASEAPSTTGPPGTGAAPSAPTTPTTGGMPPPPGYSSKSSLGTPALREALQDQRELRKTTALYKAEHDLTHQYKMEEIAALAAARAANPTGRPVMGPATSVRFARQMTAQGKTFNDINGEPIDLTSMPDEMGLKNIVWGGKSYYEPFSPNQKVITVGNVEYAVNPADITSLGTGAGAELGVKNAPKTTVRTVIGSDAHGNPIYGKLPSTQTPASPGAEGRTGGLPAPPDATAPNESTTPVTDESDIAQPGFSPRTGVPISAHAPDGAPAQVTIAGRDSKGRPTLEIVPNQTPKPSPGTPVAPGGGPAFFTPAMQKAQQEKATPVRLAARQLMGDPNQPDFKSLMDYGDLADSSRAQEHVRVAWDIIKRNMQEAEQRRSGTLSQIFSNYMGLPQALASSEFSVARDAVAALSPREKEMLDREFAAYGTVMGLRSLTKGSAAKFSVGSMEREVPILGVSAMNSRQFYDKLGLLNEEIMSGMEGISNQIMPDKTYYVQKADELRELAKKGAPKLPPPPGGAGGTAEDLERKLGIKR